MLVLSCADSAYPIIFSFLSLALGSLELLGLLLSKVFPSILHSRKFVSQLLIHLYTTVLAANTTSNPKLFQKNYTTLREGLLAATFAALLSAALARRVHNVCIGGYINVCSSTSRFCQPVE